MARLSDMAQPRAGRTERLCPDCGWALHWWGARFACRHCGAIYERTWWRDQLVTSVMATFPGSSLVAPDDESCAVPPAPPVGPTDVPGRARSEVPAVPPPPGQGTLWEGR